ncbi:NEDD4-binding protein 2 isoform X2 [Brienomyrus brachyistius]|uniref:NEDD4-binding protein 2 isoform X2 n=1 Tax=Brienomyrus brachyistius TaxID=42636 RepID=UPI0020B1F9A4|nr:NEDD4-binding protein 2 isoform X2 [Brienomyrus brachyistius]
MPKKKKNGQSPTRVPGMSNNAGVAAGDTGTDRMAKNSVRLPADPSVVLGKDDVVKRMQEMFAHLDPEVVYMVLAECDFKVEKAMDSMLEMSAETAEFPPCSVSGFETAAALLEPKPLLGDTVPELTASRAMGFQGKNLDGIGTHLTADFDVLIDRELASISALSSTSSSSLPLPEAHQALPELLQSSVQSFHANTGVGALNSSGSCSPLSDLSVIRAAGSKEPLRVLDFSHLTCEHASSSSSRAAPDHPSAFQAYRKGPHATTSAGVQYAKSDPSGVMSQPVAPSFVVPVVNPGPWNPQCASYWLGHSFAQQPPVKLAATVPKSWTMPTAPKPVPLFRSNRLIGRLLVLLRGAPGSGKSTLARNILQENPGGVVLSTDDYFHRDGFYYYDPSELAEAHEWNHKRAKESFEKGLSPIIIDNTNMQCWEMKPYVSLALQYNFKVMFREPDTWWKFKPRELERRNKHGVRKEKIRYMLDHYERHVSVDSIMRSFGTKSPVPGSSSAKLPHEESSLSQPSSSDVKPDLVEEPYLNLGSMKENFQLFSSLPDVSSVGGSSTKDEAMDSSVGFFESSHPASELLLVKGQDSHVGGAPEGHSAELQESWATDWDPDSCSGTLEGSQGLASEWIPETGQEDRENDKPVAFFESISQRVKRGRGCVMQADTTDDVLQDQAALRLECINVGDTRSVDSDIVVVDETQPELMDFVGDWPLEAQEQREQRTREKDGWSPLEEGGQLELAESCSGGSGGNTGSQMMELQKLLDLLQVSVASSGKCVNPPVDSRGSSLVGSAAHSSFEDLTLEAGSGVEDPLNLSLSSKEGSQGLGRESKPELLDCVADWKDGEAMAENVMPQCPAAGERVTAVCATVQENNGLSLTREDSSCSTGIKKEFQNGKLEELQSPSGSTVGKPVTPGTTSAAEMEGSPTVSSPSGSQERRLRQNRRSGKHCRLALTFSNNSSCAPQVPPESLPSTSLYAAFPGQPASSSTIWSYSATQTNPQDFALLWRLDRQCQTNTDGLGVKVMKGDSTRFLPKPAGAQECSNCPDVPYRVVHDKGAQVEEQELSSGNNKLQDLQILSRHFKLVSFDTLEDLYEKCHQDMEWTTNLLLDSGEQLFKDDENGDALGPDIVSRPSGDGSHMAVEPSCTDAPVSNAEQSATLNCSEVQNPTLDADLQMLAIRSKEEVAHNADAEQLSMQNDMLTLESSNGTNEPVFKEGPMNCIPVPEAPLALHSSLDIIMPPSMSSRQAELLLGDLKGFNEDQINEAVAATASQKPEEQTVCWGVEYESNVTDDAQVEEPVSLGQFEELNKKKEEDSKEKLKVEDQQDRPAKQQCMPVDIQSLELKLPTELALQLSELFGPVGIDPGALTPEDCAVQIDLNLARLLHQKWKDAIQERHRQEALFYQLLQEGSVPLEKFQFLRPDGLASLRQPDTLENLPFMDHWNAPLSHTSLRDIMFEEEALQHNLEKYRSNHVELGKRDGAALLKEKQLYSMFPAIDRHFLKDMFRDNNYSLEQTEQFLRSILDQGPVKTVVAPEVALLRDAERNPGKETRPKVKDPEPPWVQFQDTEDPEYEDFRAEAALQRKKQQECFSKAADAYRQGRKQVASFYSQQGHLHGQKMKEANHRAAVQIFERVNSSLLPQNVLDLHGLHVDEALYHLGKVLEGKTAEWQQGGCGPQLTVITGRGNHSQGGVARIRPAVIDYLSSNSYRYSEPRPGIVLVTLH